MARDVTAVERLRALMSTAPAQVASDCAGVMLGVVTLLLVLADHVWEAVVPGAVVVALRAIDERVGDETVLSRPYVLFRRVLYGTLLVGVVAGLWLHAATRDWSVAIHAVLVTFLLGVIVFAQVRDSMSRSSDRLRSPGDEHPDKEKTDGQTPDRLTRGVGRSPR